MNCTLSPNTSELQENGFIYHTDSLPEMMQVGQQNYTTVPMPVFKPSHSSYVADEEELYSSFEQAISERSQSLHLTLTKTQHSQRGRKKLSNRQYHRSVGISISSTHNLAAPQHTWQFTLLLVAFGLMCLLAGFDLMGLLILHMH